MKISVIVPVYNAKDTIVNCLGNLLNQTCTDMEILLIDDASTDGCDAILQDAKRQFPDKVRVFKQEKNQGPGAARNVGLDMAQGEYIGFVDADDVVDVTMYEKLYDIAKRKDADITDCGFFRESQNKALLHFDSSFCGDLDNEKKSGLIASGGFTVTKLFRRSMIESIGLRFRPSYGLEDMDLLIRAIAEAKKIASTDEVLYVYKDSGASLSKEMDFGKYYQNHIGALIGIYEKMHDLPDYPELCDACEYCMTALYTNIMSLAYKMRNDIPRKVLDELLTGLIQVRQTCITHSIEGNPYYHMFGDETRIILKLADEGVDALLSYNG
ncbi:MAG: glycosyltransferase [Lachnospiraceae bacterium]|nr:glycosyltransferase [Lachnospiraceae bacterium]